TSRLQKQPCIPPGVPHECESRHAHRVRLGHWGHRGWWNRLGPWPIRRQSTPPWFRKSRFPHRVLSNIAPSSFVLSEVPWHDGLRIDWNVRVLQETTRNRLSIDLGFQVQMRSELLHMGRCRVDVEARDLCHSLASGIDILAHELYATTA